MAVGGVGSEAEVVQQVQSAFCSLDRAQMLLLLLLILLETPRRRGRSSSGTQLCSVCGILAGPQLVSLTPGNEKHIRG